MRVEGFKRKEKIAIELDRMKILVLHLNYSYW